MRKDMIRVVISNQSLLTVIILQTPSLHACRLLEAAAATILAVMP